jgi:hypothetical protein
MKKIRTDIRHMGYKLLIGSKEGFRWTGDLFPSRDAADSMAANLARSRPNLKYRIEGLRLDHTLTYVEPRKHE